MSLDRDDAAGHRRDPEGRHVTGSAEETEELGRRLGARLGRGDVVVLTGDLGAGKTTFARGLCRALGVAGPVTSPTYTIGQVYEGRDEAGEWLPVSHLDLYRLVDLEEEDPALIEDYLGPDRIALVEWPEPAMAELGRRIAWRVEIEHNGGDRRRITIARG